MAENHVYTISELVGSSQKSAEDAIEACVARAAASNRHLDWFEVSEIRGHIEDGPIGHYQVVLKVGARHGG